MGLKTIKQTKQTFKKKGYKVNKIRKYYILLIVYELA